MTARKSLASASANGTARRPVSSKTTTMSLIMANASADMLDQRQAFSADPRRMP
jgi:hypothetical protein